MKEQWSSRIGFLFVAIGAAAGLGSVWRFPTIVGENGGGAYLVPYLVATVICAMPLMILELSVGRHFSTDVVSAFRSAHPKYSFVGWFVCATVFVILSYYLVITGWTLAFLIISLIQAPMTFVGFSQSYLPIIPFVASAALIGVIVASGIRAGIERVSSILIPFIVVILCFMAAFVATLPGFSAGLAYYLTPDFSVLANPSLWIAAIGQSFYTLSIGLGILITYGSYMNREENILESSLIISAGDLFISLLAGFVIFPIVFSFGLAPTAGAELAFSTLPQAFALIPGGNLIAAAFFLLLFLTALLSSVAMLEVPVAAVMGVTAWSRRDVCILLTVALVLLGLPSALSYTGFDLTLAGERVLDVMDDVAGTFGIIVSGILGCLIFGWYVDRNVIESEVRSENRLIRYIVPLCRYVLPLAMTAVLLVTLAGRVAG